MTRLNPYSISNWMALVLLVFSVGLVRGQDSFQPKFTDVTAAAGIDAKHYYGDDDLSNIVEGTGAGGMFFDYDADGWLDIYLPCGCWHPDVSDNMGRKYKDKLVNRLYRNNQDGTFSDVTEKAGVGSKSFSCGCSAADFDDDGDLDLYVLNYGPNILYRNNGNGTFTDISEASGLDGPAWSRGAERPCWSLSAPWFDCDNDGDLDVYVVNYLEYDAGKFRSYYAAAGYPGPLSYSGQPDALFRNNGDGTFTEITKAAGLFNPDGRGMSGTAADLDDDGYLDLYVANDAMENCYYRNNGDGTFTEEGLFTGLAFGEGGQGVSSMGPTTGDMDGDGRIDVYIPDMGYGCLMMNRGDYFEDRTARAKLTIICGQYTGWGGVLFDFDNDRNLDIFIANGNAHHEYTEEDVLLRNDGAGMFEDVAGRAGGYFREKYVGRGAASGDYDNDGDLDLLVINLNDAPRLLRNDSKRGNWLTLSLKRENGKSDAIGARVAVTADSVTRVREVMPTTGYLSQSDARAHFGLGTATKADRVEIRWPDRTTTVLTDVPGNQFLTVVKNAE